MGYAPYEARKKKGGEKRMGILGRCRKCGVEDILNTDGLCPVCVAETEGMKYRCFHCLRFYRDKPEACPECGCPYFTPIERCREEDRMIEESARQAAANMPEGSARFLATLETQRIREQTTE